MTPTLWMKFGGAALADGAAVRRSCEIVAARLDERPAVVVSAHEGVTRLLRETANAAAGGELRADALRLKHKALLRQLELEPELLDAHLRELAGVLGLVRSHKRLGEAELDYVLSFGERMSARVVAATLRRMGVAATAVDAFDLGLVSDSAHGRARPLPGCAAGLRSALEQLAGVPIVTGFLARDERGALTTLGRNGSDLTAALLAEATGASELVFWKHVPGVMSADPRDVPTAHCLERLSFEQARQLALSGADVLHPEALAPAQRSGAAVLVRDARRPELPGTRLTAEVRADRPLAIASEAELVRMELAPNEEGVLARRLAELLAVLQRVGVEPRVVNGGATGVSVCVAPSANLEAVSEELSRRVQLGVRVAAVTVVGASGSALAARALAALESDGIRPLSFAADEERACMTALVPPDERARCVRSLHEALLAPLCRSH